MSNLREETRDITSVSIGIVMHGCNCQGVMGSGAALAVRRTWPIAYESYVDHCISFATPADALGSIDKVVIQRRELFVYNALTQVNYGQDGRVYADLDAVVKCYEEAIADAVCEGLPIYTPKIGCGLGGLSYEEDLKPELEHILSELLFDVDLVICDVAT